MLPADQVDSGVKLIRVDPQSCAADNSSLAKAHTVSCKYMVGSPLPPAKRLLGLTLDGGWVVVKELPPLPTATGGFFSTGYLVRHDDGTEGFLKALDYSEAFTLDPSQIAPELQRI